MNKKKLIILISSISAFILASVVTTILLVNHFKNNNSDDGGEVVQTELITLQKPLNLKIDEYTLSWDKVENASSYMIYIGKNEYVVNTNSIDLNGRVNERDIVSVKSIGKDKYKDSVKSIELIFIHDKVEEEITLIEQSLSNFLIHNFNDIDTSVFSLNEIAGKLFKVGVTHNDIEQVIFNINVSIENNKNIVNKEKISVFENILDNFFNIMDLDMNEYALVNSLINLYSIYFEGCYKNNGIHLEIEELQTNYFENDKPVENYAYLYDFLRKLESFTIQNYTSIVHYYKLYKVQINNFINTLDGGKLFESATASTEIVTLKNTLCSFLVGEMPLIIEFNDFKKGIINVYNNTADLYLLEKISDEEVDNYLNNLYSYNHYAFSFLNSLDDKESKILVGQFISVYNSISPEIRNDFFELTSFFDLSNEYNIKTVFDKHFDEIFGKYLFTINQNFIDKITEISKLNNVNDIVNELFAYFKIKEYFLLNDSAKEKVEEYFTDFIPEDLQYKGDFNGYLVEIFSNFDYKKYIDIQYDSLFNIEETDKVINLVLDYAFGLVSEEEFSNQLRDYIDYENSVNIDYDGILKEIGLAFNEKTPKIGEFFTSLYELENLNIDSFLSVFGITNEDVNFDASGFIEHIRSLIGFKFNDTFTVENFELFIDNVTNEIKNQFSGFTEIYNIYLIFKNIDNEDFNEIDIENLLNNNSINYMALYTLLNDLNIKTARFEARYVPAYSNGLEIGKVKEDGVALLTYLLFGTKAPYMENIISDFWDIVSKTFDAISDYQRFIDGFKHYTNLLNSFDEYITIENIEKVYYNEDEFNEFMDSFDEEINKAYKDLKFVLDSIPFRESILIKYHFSELISTNGDLEDLGTILEELYQFELDIYDGLLKTLDEKQEDYESKSTAIRRIYKNLHILIDPIEEFVKDVYDDFFDKGELTEDDMIDFIYNLIVKNSDLIISFYNKSVMLELANDLNIVFEGYPIDFSELMNELCLHGDLLVNRLNAQNLPSSALKIVREAVNTLSEFEKLKTIYDKLKLLVETDQMTLEEYEQLYVEYITQYNIIENSLVKTIELLDNYILQGIDELKQDNPVYEERKDDFLLMDNIEDLLKVFDKLNKSIEPNTTSLVVEEFELINAILKEVFTLSILD